MASTKLILASSKTNAQVSVKDTAVSSIEALNFGGTVETQLRDQLVVGTKYEQTASKFKPRALFATWTAKVGNPLKVLATYNLAANSAEVETEYEIQGLKIEAEIDTARPRWMKRISLSKGCSAKGRDVEFTPSYNFETSIAALKSRLSLNADTDVELHLTTDDLMDKDSLDATLTLDHAINDKNSISPIFSLNTGAVKYEYKRTLSEDAELVAKVNPGTDIKIKWEDQGSKGLWTTKVLVPWGKPESSSVSVKRKFEF